MESGYMPLILLDQNEPCLEKNLNFVAVKDRHF